MNTNGLKLYQGNGAEQTCQLTPQSEVKVALKWSNDRLDRYLMHLGGPAFTSFTL